jgi:hypothetical protein
MYNIYLIMVETRQNATEQEYIEMANHFKEVMEKKTNEIKSLKKALMTLYALAKIADEMDDKDVVCMMRQYASEFIDTFIFDEEGD